MRRTRTAPYYICNTFLGGVVPPTAVIALNSPSFGGYERRLLRTVLRVHNQSTVHREEKTILTDIRCASPLFICADGVFSKIAAVDTLLAARVDYVIGDYDSLKPGELAIDASLSKATEFCSRLHSRKAAADSRDVQPAQKEGPFVLHVKDQDTSDFEKCLQVCEAFLTEDAQQRSAEGRRHIVLVLGSQGGEWHHELAALHTAAKFCGPVLDVRLHTPFSTIAFCNPHGATVLARNKAYETSVVGVVPIGAAPTSLRTRGLKWEVDFDAEPGSTHDLSPAPGPLPFGFFSDERRAFISTSNRMLHDTVDIECRSNIGGGAAVVALTINWKHSEWRINGVGQLVDVSQGTSLANIANRSDSTSSKPDQTSRIRIGTSAVIQKSGALSLAPGKAPTYLVVRRAKVPYKGMWSFPGGSVAFGEASLAAAKREVLEETNLCDRLVALDPATLQVVEVIPSADSASHFILVQYAGVVIGDAKEVESSAKAQDDVDSLDWWTLEQIRAAEDEGRATPGLTASVLTLLDRQQTNTSKL